jgi:hypothetical protein
VTLKERFAEKLKTKDPASMYKIKMKDLLTNDMKSLFVRMHREEIFQLPGIVIGSYVAVDVEEL